MSLSHDEDTIKRIAGMPAAQAAFREHCILEIYCACVASGTVSDYSMKLLAEHAVKSADALIEAIAR